MKTQQENWVTRLRKSAGAKGPAEQDLDDVITPDVLVQDLSTFDYDWAGQIKQLKSSTVVPAVAAQSSICSLFNPAGSGVLAIIDQLELAVSGAAVCTIQGGFVFANPGGTVQGVLPSDSRWFNIIPPPATGLTPIILAGQQAVANPITSLTDRFTAFGSQNQSVYLRRIVLSPGVGYVLFNTTVNISLTVEWLFRERVAASGELP